MDITDENLTDIVYDAHEDFATVADSEIVDKYRWHVVYQKVVRNNETGKYYRLFWSQGATEYQDNGIEDVSIEEVRPVEVTKVEYVKV